VYVSQIVPERYHVRLRHSLPCLHTVLREGKMPNAREKARVDQPLHRCPDGG
jgi:hypothetical protein